jgi:drug/metabolite transporter (DMT)-like permease
VVVALLIAGAAIAHATWNVTVKRAGTSGAGFLWLSFLVGVVVFAPFGITSLLSIDPSHWLPLALVSGVLQVGYFLLLQHAYRFGDVSVVYPLARGTGPLLSVVLAIVLLGERPGWLGLAGAAVVVAGVVVIGLAGGRAGASVNRPGVVFGLLVGVVIAAYTLWDASAVTRGGLPPVGLYWAAAVVQVLLLAVPALRRPRETLAVGGRHWGAVLVVGVLSPLAYILILVALQVAPVSVVAPAREVSVVLVGLAGWLWFREPHPVQRLVGAGVVLLGVALLAV